MSNQNNNNNNNEIKTEINISEVLSSNTKQEPDINLWWCKLRNHETYSNKKKREILSNYIIGDILSFVRPDFVLPELPTTLRIALVGRTGAGKSSLVRTILSALVEDGVPNLWRSDVGPSEQTDGDRVRMSRQLGGEQHVFSIGVQKDPETKKEKKMFIELVDTRGLLDETNISEATDFAQGKRPVNSVVERLGDDEYISRFTSAFPKKAERFHLCILVIPADLPPTQEKIDMYVELRRIIRQTLIPVFHVFTKGDFPDAQTKINNLKSSLGLAENDSLQMTCYPNTLGIPSDEQIDSQALFTLLWAIIIADSKGIPINQEKNWVIQQREVMKYVRDAGTIIKNKAAQESKMMYALIILIVLLLINLFK